MDWRSTFSLSRWSLAIYIRYSRSGPPIKNCRRYYASTDVISWDYWLWTQDYDKASKKRLKSGWNEQKDNDGPNRMYLTYHDGIKEKFQQPVKNNLEYKEVLETGFLQLVLQYRQGVRVQ